MKRLLAVTVILGLLLYITQIPTSSPSEVYPLMLFYFMPLVLLLAIIVASFLIDFIARKKK